MCPSEFGVNLVVGRWWLGLEWLVPPPVGVFAGGSGVGRDGGWGCGWWSGQRSVGQRSPVAVGNPESVDGPGDGDDAAVVEAVVVRA